MLMWFYIPSTIGTDTCLPESPEPAKMKRCRKDPGRHASDEKVEESVSHILVNGGLEHLLPWNPCTPSPLEAIRRSSSSSVEGYTSGTPSPHDDSNVSFTGSTNRRKSIALAY
jgi:hypothetical protein